MNIKATINRIFNNNSYESSIINIGDVIQIPKRKDIEDQQLLLNIDKYKKEYLDILSTKSYLLPNMLSSKEIQDEMKINIDLIVKLYLENEELTNDKILLITKYLRLRLYLDKVTELGNVVLARLIALKEIFNEKIIISKHKRQRVSYEINNLLSILVTFNSQRSALENEYNIYHEKLISSNIDLNLTDEESNEINKKLEDVCELVKSVMPNINTNEYQGITGLVALERMLEIYVYQNKEKIDGIKKQGNRLNIIYFDLLEDSNLRDELYKDLRNLEIGYRIFNEYGRNLITDDDLLEFYKLKFSILTHKFYENNYDIKIITDNTTNKELNCYKKIVYKMIEDIVKGNNFYDSTRYTDHGNNIFYKSKAINYMCKVLKDGEKEFNSDKILNDQFLLNTLLAFSNQKLLNQFYKNYKIESNVLFDINRYEFGIVDFHKSMFEWEKFLPLDTIFKIDNINEKISSELSIIYIMKCDDNKTYDRITYLKKLYLLTNDTKNDFIDNGQILSDKKFYFPEGLKGIFSSTYEVKTNVHFLNELLKNIDHSRVYFPKTLKYIRDDIFTNKIVNEFVLNQDIEEIDLHIFLRQESHIIEIPPTVKRTIGTTFSDYFRQKVLKFTSFKKSKILNDNNNLNKLFEIIIYNPLLHIERIININVGAIILSDDNTDYVINKEELKNIEKDITKEWVRRKYWTRYEMIVYAVNAFKEIVYKKTGYILGEEKNLIENHENTKSNEKERTLAK